MGLFSFNKYTSLTIALIIVIGNGIVDHYFAPMGVELVPIIIIISTSAINLNKQKFNILLQSIITFVLISLTDIGIKLYGGGMHDGEGLGFMNFFLMVGLVPALVILIVAAIRDKNASTLFKILAIFLFILLICLHFNFLGDLGLGRYYPIKN